jgi:hypothetical protein
MDWLQVVAASISLLAAVLSLVAVNRAGDIIRAQEVGRKAKAGHDQTFSARQ